MTARLVHACDFCGEFVERDVTSDAAAMAKVYAGYPGMWSVGTTHDCCPKSKCRAALTREDEAPDEGEGCMPEQEEA